MNERRDRKMRERGLIGATLSLLLLTCGDLSSAQNQPSPKPITFAGIRFSGSLRVRPEVWDWFDDVGGPVRDFGRRMEAVDRYAVAHMRTPDAPLPRTGGCFVVRATTPR